MERIEGNVDGLKSPIGIIPLYEDLSRMFSSVLGKPYTRENYESQFTIRLNGYKQKFLRIREIYANIEDTPYEVLEILDKQIADIEYYMRKFGDNVSPFQL